MVAGLVTNIVFGFIRGAILLAAVERAGVTLVGYSRDTISAYVWLSQRLISAVNIGGSGSSELSERIRNGDVAVDFTRPVDAQASYLAADLGARSWPGCTCRLGCSPTGCPPSPWRRRSPRSCRSPSTSSPVMWSAWKPSQLLRCNASGLR